MSHRTPAQLQHLFRRVAEVSHRTPDRDKQAAALSLTVSQLYDYRYKAKAAGHDVAPIANVGQFTRRMDKITRVEREMRGPGCPRCFLRGAHVCTSAGLVALVQSRMSRWVEPAGGGEEAA